MTDRNKAEICWNCLYWSCPNWHDPQSHKCPSGCMGRCKKHNERREATDTCEEWMVRINTPTQIGYCLSVQAAAVFASVREYLEKTAKSASDFTTPVIDALTQNAPAEDEEVTEAMAKAGVAAALAWWNSDRTIAENALEIYAAMRAARPPVQMSPPDNRLDQILAGVRRLEDATFGNDAYVCGAEEQRETDLEEISALRAENETLRGRLASLAEAGTGYSQQTMNALVKERDALQKEVEALRKIAEAVLSIGHASQWRYRAQFGTAEVIVFEEEALALADGLDVLYPDDAEENVAARAGPRSWPSARLTLTPERIRAAEEAFFRRVASMESTKPLYRVAIRAALLAAGMEEPK